MNQPSAEKSKETEAFNMLYEIITVVNESLDVNEVLEAAADKAMSLFGADSAGMYVVENNKFALKAQRNLSPDVAGEIGAMKVDKRFVRPEAVSERLSDAPKRIMENAKRGGIQSVLTIPVRLRDRLVGLLVLASGRYGFFNEADLKIAEIINSPMGLAIENANLHRKLQGIDQYTFALMNSIHAAVMTIQNHTILWCNPISLDMFGYHPGELTGKPMKVLLKDETAYKTIKRNIDYAIETKGSFCFELEAKRKDGGEFKAEYCISLLKQEGSEPYIVVAVIRDITKEKRLQARVAELESMVKGG